MSADVKWIKISVTLFDDEKIRQIRVMPDGGAMVLTWLRLLLLAGQVNQNGYLMMAGTIPYTEEMLAVHFGESPKDVASTMKLFMKYGMVEKIDGAYHITNWARYQDTDSMERLRESGRERTRRYRDRRRNPRVMPALADGGEADADEAELRRIAEDHRELLDMADDIRLTESERDRTRLIDLYAAYGRDKLMYAMSEAADHKKVSFSYVEAICKNAGNGGKKRDAEDDDSDSLKARGLEDWDDWRQ